LSEARGGPQEMASNRRADFVIRPPRESEWAEIAYLLRVCFADEGPEIGGKAFTTESVAELQQPGSHLRVMEVAEKIIGFVYLDKRLKAASKLAVDPSFRGRDYGKLLMKAAEKKAKAIGWTKLLVGVLDTKQKLVAYYRGLGYAETGKRYPMDTYLGYTGPVHEMIILSKKLGVPK
jgi:GNAT superfamily N-acetyltransferase